MSLAWTLLNCCYFIIYNPSDLPKEIWSINLNQINILFSVDNEIAIEGGCMDLGINFVQTIAPTWNTDTLMLKRHRHTHSHILHAHTQKRRRERKTPVYNIFAHGPIIYIICEMRHICNLSFTVHTRRYTHNNNHKPTF